MSAAALSVTDLARELRALGLPAPCVRDVLHVVCAYSPGGELAGVVGARVVVTRKMLEGARKVAVKLRAVERHFDDPEVHAFLVLVLMTAPGGLAPWLESLRAYRVRLAAIKAPAKKAKRGPKADAVRASMAADCAAVLHRAGLPLARSRDGLLARVLAVALAAAGLSVPEDLFSLVRAAAATAPALVARRDDIAATMKTLAAGK